MEIQGVSEIYGHIQVDSLVQPQTRIAIMSRDSGGNDNKIENEPAVPRRLPPLIKNGIPSENNTPKPSVENDKNLDSLGSSASFRSRESNHMHFTWLNESFPQEYASGKMQLSVEKFLQFVNDSGQFHVELFAVLDPDKSGRVTRRELLGAFSKLRCRRSQDSSLSRLSRILGGGGNAYCEYDIEQFKEILTKDALRCIFDLFDVNGNGQVSTSEIQRSLEKISCMDNNAMLLAWMDDQFTKIAGDKRFITKSEFQKALKCENTFFVDRLFALLDVDDSGTLELKEVIDGINALMRGDKTEKMRFLFQVYDTDNSGRIDRDEFTVYLKSCLDESNVVIPPYQFERLVSIFFDDADRDRSGYITFEELQEQFAKYPQMLDDLCLSTSNWLRPAEKKSKRSFQRPEFMTWAFIRNNASVIVFWIIYTLLSVGLFVEAASRYWVTSNALVVIARGAGQLLNFNSAFVLTLTFRNTITWLRNTRLSKIINFDNYIMAHKTLGYIILFLSLLHSAMHFGNFAMLSATTVFSFVDYVFTTKPGIGWVAGSASITGDLLLIILISMVIFALPCIRNNGKFLLFYLTHQLYIVYLILLLLHGPQFWKWFITPGVFLFCEIILRLKCVNKLRYGVTRVIEARTLPSNVTQLVIERPEAFKFEAGDYVFLNIPDIADFEWHPFTISSAPEQKDFIWLHVRAVGNWTRHLYNLIDEMTEPEKVSRKIAVAKEGIKRFALSQKRVGGMNKKSNRVNPAEDLRRMTIKAFQSAEKHHHSGSDDSRVYSGAAGIRVYMDGPYGAPSSKIFNTDHAVLIAAGIGVTPFACILQSILNRYMAALNQCPRCHFEFTKELPPSIMQLRKVDFMWINRNQESFNWFLSILAGIEQQQQKLGGGALGKFIDIHLYLTSLMKKNDIRAVGLQMALDLMHEVENEDVITGLRTQMQGGRPDFDKLFRKFRDEDKGKVTVFYCGPPVLGSILNEKCMQYGFKFKREIF